MSTERRRHVNSMSSMVWIFLATRGSRPHLVALASQCVEVKGVLTPSQVVKLRSEMVGIGVKRLLDCKYCILGMHVWLVVLEFPVRHGLGFLACKRYQFSVGMRQEYVHILYKSHPG